MASSGRPSYRLNLNRNPTQKWAQAKEVDYEGDDWGDDDDDEEEDDYDNYNQYRQQSEPASAGPQRHTGWEQGAGYTTQRSFTNPVIAPRPGRTSLDREDERRYFASGNFDHRQQSQQVMGHHPVSQNFDPTVRDHYDQPSLQINTHVQGPSSHSAVPPGTQAGHQTDTYGVPYSAPVTYLHSRTQPTFSTKNPSIGSSNMGYEQQGAEPRQSLLAQQHSRTGSNQPHDPQDSRDPYTTHSSRDSGLAMQSEREAADTKPPPFIRPADIYKRVEQEREKERLSQESSRPSLDSIHGKPSTDIPQNEKSAQSSSSNTVTEDSDGHRRRKPTLDTVVERKSEYGFGNLLPDASNSQSNTTGPSLNSGAASGDLRRPADVSRTASSVYTESVEPTSAASAKSANFAQSPSMARTVGTDKTFPQIHHGAPPAERDTNLDSASRIEDKSVDLPNFEQGYSTSLPDSAVTTTHPSRQTTRQMGSGKDEPHRLQHQPSLGYQSVVQQAFGADDNSNLSPSVSNDLLPRSNSASTSDISPIINRSGNNFDTVSGVMNLTDIQEERFPSHERTESVATVKSSDRTSDTATLPSTTFQPGYRRDKSPRALDEGAARRPLSVEIPAVPEAQHGVMSNVTSHPTQDPAAQILPATRFTPTTSEAEPLRLSETRSDLAPTPTSHTTSEDWHEWQVQRRQFNARHGIQDSSTASPTLSSSISRSESPAKGTVKDIAEKLETNSGQASPASANTPINRVGTPLKMPHSRSDNARPTIPGGWMSDTTNSSSVETSEGSEKLLRPQLTSTIGQNESTESIPTATIPKNWQSSRSGPVDTAFAAAAAAGNAMAGAFSGTAFTHNTATDSDVTSDDDSYSERDQPQLPHFSDTRDFASAGSGTHDRAGTYQSPPSMLPSVSDAAEHPSHDTGRGMVEAPVDFPAPLRTNRINDQKQSSPRISIPPVPSSSNQEDPDLLQQEIVKSLTPKSSNIEDPKPHGEIERSLSVPEPHFEISRPSTASDDDVLPREYNSYWEEPQTQPVLKSPSPERFTQAVGSKSLDTHNGPGSAQSITHETHHSRPVLESKYSWENALDELSKPKELTLAESLRDSKTEEPSTPTQRIISPPSILTPPVPLVQRVTAEADDETPRNGAGPVAIQTPTRKNPIVFPTDKTDFKSILAYDDPTQRIRAFDENRKNYAEHNGLLEQWLLTMNVPEHADVFSNSRLPRTQPLPNQSSFQTSPRRDVGQATGAKQMQEDGRRLLAAAGKYGGKAGIAAKGLFAKGKDRFRTASSGDKVSLKSQRRSSTFEADPPAFRHSRTHSQSQLQPQLQTQQHEYEQQRSCLPETAPQIPTPTLETPPGESSLAALQSKFDQMFDSNSQPITIYSLSNFPASVPAGNARFTDTNADIKSSTISKAAVNSNPPPSVVAALPIKASAGSSSQSFPNYGIANDGSRTVTAQRDSRVSGSSLARPEETASKVSMEVDRSQSHENRGSLSLPRARRPSSVSDVSDLSAVPDDKSEQLSRNVSPALDHKQPAPLTVPVMSAKEAEAMQDQTMAADGSLPAYSAFRSSANNRQQTRIRPGTQIVPMSDLDGTNTGTQPQPVTRPFSFSGSETLNNMYPPQLGQHQTQMNSEAHGPNTGNVPPDVEKSPRPNITEHPAFRSEQHHEARVESENPLPSSRRSRQDLAQAYQRQQTEVPQEGRAEQGYRIPGPYVQEYRSPRSSRPNVAPENQRSQQEATNLRPNPQNDMDNSHLNHPTTGPVNPAGPMDYQYETDRNKGRTLSGIFQSKPKSQNYPSNNANMPSSTQMPSYQSEENQKRRGLFGLGDRSNSSARRMSESRSQASQEESNRTRKLSMDMLRPSTFSERTQPGGKKKRSSGIGGFFSRLGAKDRDNNLMDRNMSATSQSYPSSPMNYRQPSAQTASTFSPGGDQYRQEAMRSDQMIQSFPLPGKSGSAYQETSGHHRTGDGHIGPSAAVTGPSPTTAQRPQAYGNNNLPIHSNVPVQSQMHSNNANPQVYSNIPIQPQIQPQVQQLPPPPERPAVHGAVTLPVPNTRANRDISYGTERTYVPPSSPRSHVVPSPVDGTSGIQDRVRDLHKRSRSPRLGRPASDDFSRDAPDNTSELGKFTNRRISPEGGIVRSNKEQENPWVISLPGGGDGEHSDDEVRGRRSKMQADSLRDGNNSVTSGIVSPATPHQHPHYDHNTDIISPVASSGMRRDQLQTRSPTVHNHQDPTGFPLAQPGHTGPSVGDNTEVLASIPPSISNADIITNPNPNSALNATSTQRASNFDQAIGVAATTPESAPVAAQLPRASKQVSIEQKPTTSAIANPTISRAPTVAEQMMGVQPAARGTMPQHRSTVPVQDLTNSPVISQPKPSSTWPDARPHSTTSTRTSNGATTVTTTTMKSGAKHGRGSVKTNTMVLDSDTPSRSSSIRKGLVTHDTAGSSPASNQGTSGTPVPAVPHITAPSASAPTPPSTSTAAAPTPASALAPVQPIIISREPSPASRQKSLPRTTVTTSPAKPQYGKSFDAVELPGSKPAGYESEEEIVMSATAYPGQEWMPDFAHGATWDD